MNRSIEYQKNITIRGGNTELIDPLMINIDANTPELSNTKIEFDLDSDGKKEKISTVTAGNWFLALDKNKDGIINNGKELFGPETGNGFSELAVYDKDGNNWIDENDPVLSELKLWSHNENGEEILQTLMEKGIGAIYLGNINGDYRLMSRNNDLQGIIKNNGIYLRENGTPGIIHELDLVKE